MHPDGRAGQKQIRRKQKTWAFSSVFQSRLWIEETKELDVYETEFSWNLKGLVAIAIAIAVRKKSLAAAEPAIQFSETPPHAENEPSITVRGSRLPEPEL